MADHPQDRPKPERAGAARPDSIGGREVLAYLREHPNFLERHPEALHLLRAPSRQIADGVVDFQHFMLERLRHALSQLRDQQISLIATTRGNLAIQCRVHKAVLAILQAASFEQLLQVVTTDIAVLIDVDVVTIGIESTTANPTRLPLAGIHLLRAGTIDALLGSRETLLSSDVKGDPALFGAAAGLVRSQALIRLAFGDSAPAGLLCIGTRKPDTFHPGLATELLGFLARTLEIRISQWLGRAP